MNIDKTTILYFSPVAWNHNWQRQQVFACDFAKTNPVLFLLPIGAFNRSLFSLMKRVLFHTKLARQGIGRQKYEPPKNVYVLSLKFIPWHNNRLIESMNGWLIQRQVMSAVRKHALPQSFVFWTGNPSRTVSRLIQRFHPVLSIYDNAMRYEELPGASAFIREHEEYTLSKSDIVITDNMFKYDEFRTKHPRVLREPQGVDLQLFDRTKAWDIPPVLKNMQKPIIGYYGSLQDVFDYKLMEAVMTARPDYQFVAIGPARNTEKLQQLTRHDNFLYVPPVPQSELPQYLQKFDVALIPYQVTEYTVGTFPTKLFEYLSFLKPVVSEPIPEVAQYDQYVYLAKEPAAFADAIDQALRNGPKNKDSLAHFVQENSWDRRFQHIVDAIHEYQ